MAKLLSLLIVAFLASEALCQVPRIGFCPRTTVVQNFDVQRYLGRWFEIKSYFAIFQFGSSCTEAIYSANPNGNVGVLNKAVRLGAPISIAGEAALVTPGQGSLIVNLNGTPVSTTPNYLVLGTDYENFAVVFSCRQASSGLNLQNAWILSRTRTLSSASAQQVSSILRANGVSEALFINTRQTNCA